MLLKITEKCSMGCSHCMNDAKPDGKHMSLETLEDSLNIIVRNNIYHCLIITGGEPTEHPVFPMFMGYIIASLEKHNLKSIITVTTNGFWILDNEENRECAKRIAAGSKNVQVNFQVSADPRFYPKRLDVTKRIWREKGFVLCDNCIERIYPQGRAKTNNLTWEAKGSKCFNIRALTKQLPSPTLESVIWALATKAKFCAPMIKINGDIVLGESFLCPSCASIYDSGEDIIQKIKDFKCNGCDIINSNLDMRYRQFVL